jgi:hypothetical protein
MLHRNAVYQQPVKKLSRIGKLRGVRKTYLAKNQEI